MTAFATEVNFDGLVGPTHNYAGLSIGNVASQEHAQTDAHPRAAALQGLAKMKRLMDLGLVQGVLPPQVRPRLDLLRTLGFTGDDAQVVAKAHQDAPHLLAAAYSASSMWAANAATVSPSADCADGRVHFTPANLQFNLHRALEAADTAALLRRIFADAQHFTHHDPLPASFFLGDEGAANHTRLCSEYGAPGIELFTYGRGNADGVITQRYLPRQTRAASQTIARLHGLREPATHFVTQNPQAVDAGVFHNDVICVGNQNVLLLHERAFVDTPAQLELLRKSYAEIAGDELHIVCVTDAEIPLADAVRSYFFNSQLVTLPTGAMALICPTECLEIPSTARALRDLPQRCPLIERVIPIDVRQSMQNGGGPACLRLRVVLTDEELAATLPGVLLTPALYNQLTAWVSRHHRETLHTDDLRDPQLIRESQVAHEDLTRLLKL